MQQITKLNWRKFPDEKPTENKRCLIIATSVLGKRFIATDYFYQLTDSWEDFSNVTHWIYADELPMPNEE